MFLHKKNDKIILENRFSTHQRITFLLYIGGPFIIKFFLLLRSSSLNYIDFLLLIFCAAVYLFLISIAFLKRGFIKIDSNLYRGSFFRGKLFFKKKIDITKTPKVAVLKFKKSQKLAWFSIANPDAATTFDSLEINILNEKHTIRKPVIDLKKEESMKKAISFLTTNFYLKQETYSPDF